MESFEIVAMSALALVVFFCWRFLARWRQALEVEKQALEQRQQQADALLSALEQAQGELKQALAPPPPVPPAGPQWQPFAFASQAVERFQRLPDVHNALRMLQWEKPMDIEFYSDSEAHRFGAKVSPEDLLVAFQAILGFPPQRKARVPGLNQAIVRTFDGFLDELEGLARLLDHPEVEQHRFLPQIQRWLGALGDPEKHAQRHGYKPETVHALRYLQCFVLERQYSGVIALLLDCGFSLEKQPKLRYIQEKCREIKKAPQDAEGSSAD